MSRHHTLPLLAVAWLAFQIPSAESAEIVHLSRWRSTASLAPNPGPGEEYFRLMAEARWDRTAPRGSERYAVQVTLPDGHVATKPMRTGEGPGSRLVTMYVPTESVRNLPPSRVLLQARVIDSATGIVLSNSLAAGIDDFPTPSSSGKPVDLGPFGWGKPLSSAEGGAAPLPRPTPDGWTFVRIPSTPDIPSFFISTTEASNRKVSGRLTGYDPTANRVDEFSLEAPDQPALSLTPEQAQSYLSNLSQEDPTGVTYRLPTQSEWLRAARAGRDTAFWWGDEPIHPEGANFLGPEPALDEDSTALCRPRAIPPTFEANPWGLFHTFGNVAEWATLPSQGFARMGGTFRTEPSSPLPEPQVADATQLGEDAYVGLRPVVSITADAGTKLARKALGTDESLANVHVTYDPDRAILTLTGEVAEPSLRRDADRRLEALWWVAAVENRISTPANNPNLLARLSPSDSPAKRIMPLGHVQDVIPVKVQWANPLPVVGSLWYVNLYLPGGGHQAYPLTTSRPGAGTVFDAVLDRSEPGATSLPPGAAVSVALSLGTPAPNPTDPQIVSTVIIVRTFTP